MGLGLPTERRGLTSDKKNGMLIDLPCGVTGGRSPPSPRRRRMVRSSSSLSGNAVFLPLSEIRLLELTQWPDVNRPKRAVIQ